jgi:Zn finger protein HypA/HybF involved in hydrogenase expression
MRFTHPVRQSVWCYECGPFPFLASQESELYGSYAHCPACGGPTDAIPADPCARITGSILMVYIELGIGLG